MKIFEKGQEVFIPLVCPRTEERFGVIKNPNKKILLGTKQIIKRIEHDRVVVGVGWFFDKHDLLENISDSIDTEMPSKIFVFDPENLTV